MNVVKVRDYLPSADIAVPVTAILGAAGFAAVLAISVADATPLDGDGIDRDRQSYIASLDAKRRVQHDYSGSDESGDDCLEATGYDIWEPGHNKLINIGTVSVQEDVIIIIPGKPDEGEPALRLEQNDGQEPLQPADDASRKILADNQCALAY